MTQTVAEAQQAVAAAEANVQQAKIAAAREQDARVVAEGRRVKALLDKTVGELERSRADEARVHLELTRFNDALAHEQQVLGGQGDDFAFTEEVDPADVRRRIDKLTPRRNRVTQQLRDVRQAVAVKELEALKLDRALTGLKYQHRNLQSIVAGKDPARGWESSVTPV